jgi:hypothetical protein
MKKTVWIAVMAIMCFFVLPLLSCKKADSNAEHEQSLSLKAPSGQSIAPSLTSLRADAARIILKKFGSAQEFQITHIEYLPVSKGFAAIISYELSNGEKGNFASFTGVKFRVISQSVITDMATAEQLSTGEALESLEGGNGGKITITCSRTGTCECKVQGTVNTNTGVVTWGCSCEQCSATVTYG